MEICFVFVIILLVFLIVKSQICEEQLDSEYMVVWPATDDCTFSTPRCINEAREFQERCCKDGQWDPEPGCFYVQKDLSPCPNNFIYDPNQQVCYVILTDTEYPPKCPFEDVLSFNVVKGLIDNSMFFGAFWMPVQRDLSNGLGFLQWVEPSELYRTNFADVYYIESTTVGKNCLLYFNSSYKVVADCSEKHNSICGYYLLNVPRNNLCQSQDGSLCRESDFSASSKCFCLGTTELEYEEFSKAEFLTPYQNFIYPSLTTEPICLFGLEKRDDGKYIWSPSATELSYTSWSPNVIFDESHKYGAITSIGWELLEDTMLDIISCFIYERYKDSTDPELIISLNEEDDRFTVVVKNPHRLKWLDSTRLLLYCFTDASSLNLLYRYPYPNKVEPTSLDFDMALFKFGPPHVQGPGHYWCESFKYPDLDVIQSNRILLRQESKFDVEFVSILNVQYVQGTDPLGIGIKDVVERILFITLGEVEHFKSYYTARIIKILDVDEEHTKVSVNVHFTSKARSPKPDPQEECAVVNSILHTALAGLEGILIDIMSFLSADYCFDETTDEFGKTLTWPTTKVGVAVYPKEYCFVTGARLSRKCTGNFIDGATWEKVEKRCDDVHFSLITNSLLDILNSDMSTAEVLESTLSLSKRFDEFEAFDVYLVGEILGKILEDPSVDLVSLSEILSNVHEVQDDVLDQAQFEMNATDNILHRLDLILLNCQAVRDGRHVEIMSENLAVIISSSQKTDISGLMLQNDNNTYTVTVLYGTVNLTKLVNTENFEIGLVLSDELKLQIKEEASVIFALYFKDVLFNEESFMSPFVSKIFGVLFPNTSGKLSGPISIYYKVKNKKGAENCAYWLYGTDENSDNIKGSWMKDSDGNIESTASLCEFWHTTHFALLLVDDASSIEALDTYVLDLITYICCGLSLLGLVGILITAILFKRWRMNTGNQILLNFTLAICIQIATFFVSGEVFNTSENFLTCTVIGMILHYSLVSQFCWMFIIAVLQFKRFVDVLGGPPKYILLKACLCGWILPLLPVLCVFLLDNENYVSGQVGLCYPSGLGLYLGIWLPIAIIVAINFVIFVYIIYSVVHKKTEADIVNNDLLFQWRLAILLFFMLGLTWSFGLLTELDFGIVFIYLFCLTATLQGFIMFLFFIVFNKGTRYLYIHAIKQYYFDRQAY